MQQTASYGGGASMGVRRDPQLVADPKALSYAIEDEYLGAQNGYAGAVNPNVHVYGQPSPRPNYGQASPRPNYGQHTHAIPLTVVREQYCICAPETPAERRLLVAVVVLAVTVVLLMAAIATVVPLLSCGDDCKDNNSGGGGMFDFILPSRMAPSVPQINA